MMNIVIELRLSPAIKYHTQEFVVDSLDLERPKLLLNT